MKKRKNREVHLVNTDCPRSSVPFNFFLEWNIRNFDNPLRFRKLSQWFAFLNLLVTSKRNFVTFKSRIKFGNFEVSTYLFFFPVLFACMLFIFIFVCPGFSYFWRSHKCITRPGAFIIFSVWPVEEIVAGTIAETWEDRERVWLF